MESPKEEGELSDGEILDEYIITDEAPDSDAETNVPLSRSDQQVDSGGAGPSSADQGSRQGTWDPGKGSGHWNEPNSFAGRRRSPNAIRNANNVWISNSRSWSSRYRPRDPRRSDSRERPPRRNFHDWNNTGSAPKRNGQRMHRHVSSVPPLLPNGPPVKVPLLPTPPLPLSPPPSAPPLPPGPYLPQGQWKRNKKRGILINRDT